VLAQQPCNKLETEGGSSCLLCTSKIQISKLSVLSITEMIGIYRWFSSLLEFKWQGNKDAFCFDIVKRKCLHFESSEHVLLVMRHELLNSM
jgi:hypothetical protein